jgi:hypothetical protein
MALRAAYPGPRLKRGFFPVALLDRVPRPQAEAELFPVALPTSSRRRSAMAPPCWSAGGRSSKLEERRRPPDNGGQVGPHEASGLLVMAQREVQRMALDQPLTSNL